MEIRSSKAVVSAEGDVRIRRALLSVSDKRGLVDFARGLTDLGVEIVSTGGTAQELASGGIETRAVEDYTGFPEMLDGRVKTLNPRIFAGLLAIRSETDHVDTLNDHEIEPIDLVCVNLYPFQAVAARRGVEDRDVIENIDIGGPSLIRAAAKNHPFTAVVVTPESYDAVLEELRQNDGRLSSRTRESLALEAFALTARYDTAISRWFGEKFEEFPQLHLRAFEKVTDLPYGENPHQRGAYYAQKGARTHLLARVEQLQGRPLSFNNLGDLSAARLLALELDGPAAVIVKHGNPCGVGLGETLDEAYEKALAGDPVSAYGGVVVLNRPVGAALGKALASQFVEVVFAPGYDEAALAELSTKEKARVLLDGERRAFVTSERDFRRVLGGLLVQDRDADGDPLDGMDVVCGDPDQSTWEELLFAWTVAKHVTSNAIVIARDGQTLGIGAGQMSRVDAVRLAIEKASALGHSLEGAVLASDAFFPFADGPKLALEAGVRAIIQPGGSKRDTEVLNAVREAGATMVLTGRRHFRH